MTIGALRERRSMARAATVRNDGSAAIFAIALDNVADAPRGCSSMVEPQVSNLLTGVRFPVPAPDHRRLGPDTGPELFWPHGRHNQMYSLVSNHWNASQPGRIGAQNVNRR